ncbi:DUF1127 domain-containing protein [Litoreibacter roseus]|uniref:YjiS-like domain-containing protein n=1 Tax=Litoreibacter roseus TaxID=2601869 RepID=A0A6N6JH21_9RHOB|nr:DUF1127 domain-containing protein [Litoreibacter roseus]GFE65621.1 hypothetical protein KIN_26950 [Litoreibacter roseus]
MTDLSAHIAVRTSLRRFSPLSYWDLYRQRRALLQLDETQLKDIGITAAEAETEANRPVWDAPSYWDR